MDTHAALPQNTKYVRYNEHNRSRDSVVGIATGYVLDCEVGVRVPVGSRISVLHVVQTGSGVHQTSYPMGIVGSFPGGKAAGAWNWPLTSK
jgi:hypothetical protein